MISHNVEPSVNNALVITAVVDDHSNVESSVNNALVITAVGDHQSNVESSVKGKKRNDYNK